MKTTGPPLFHYFIKKGSILRTKAWLVQAMLELNVTHSNILNQCKNMAEDGWILPNSISRQFVTDLIDLYSILESYCYSPSLCCFLIWSVIIEIAYTYHNLSM